MLGNVGFESVAICGGSSHRMIYLKRLILCRLMQSFIMVSIIAHIFRQMIEYIWKKSVVLCFVVVMQSFIMVSIIAHIFRQIDWVYLKKIRTIGVTLYQWCSISDYVWTYTAITNCIWGYCIHLQTCWYSLPQWHKRAFIISKPRHVTAIYTQSILSLIILPTAARILSFD